MSKSELAIVGASGRVGRRLICLANQDPAFQLTAAIVSQHSSSLGKDAGTLAGISPLGLPLRHDWPQNVQVAIDFSSPEGCMLALEHCRAAHIPLVIASTGLNKDQVEAIGHSAGSIPICYAPNMSLAVNLTMKLVQQAARALKNVGADADVEIIERHHRFKEDSPSGTALKFGQIVAEQMQLDHHQHGRQGMVGKRPRNEIGYHAVRIGDDVGQHTICFGMLGELIELRVAATNRDCYASGALAAARFVLGHPPGLYSMFDVLGM